MQNSTTIDSRQTFKLQNVEFRHSTNSKKPCFILCSTFALLYFTRLILWYLRDNFLLIEQTFGFTCDHFYVSHQSRTFVSVSHFFITIVCRADKLAPADTNETEPTTFTQYTNIEVFVKNFFSKCEFVQIFTNKIFRGKLHFLSKYQHLIIIPWLDYEPVTLTIKL